MRKIILFIWAFHALIANAQVLPPGSYLQDYYHLLQLQNENINAPITLHPSIITHHQRDSALQWNIWGERFNFDSDDKVFRIINPLAGIQYNSHLPRSYNDGPQWKGKGFNSFISAGFSGNVGVLHFTFNPIAYYAQNQAFHIPDSGLNKNPFQYPFVQRIDLVDRFGDDPVYQIHPGQSEVRVIYKNWTAGVSTQNLSIGPSRVFPILMSNQAAGIPHIDLGTATPFKTKLGRIEGKGLWGIMRESDFFDSIASNNRRYFVGVTLGYEPSFLKGLSLGIHRVLYRTWEEGDFLFKDAFFQFGNFARKNDTQVTPGIVSNDVYDGMASVSLRWKFPSVGFEVYGEYAKNDFPGDLRELIQLPDRASAHSWGFAKTVEMKNNHVMEIMLEGTSLSRNQTAQLVPSGSARFYIHHIVRHGYTHRGQLMGAGMGPGSNSNTFRCNYYYPRGMFGVNFQRIRFNDDYFIPLFAGANRAFPQEYEYTVGAQGLRFIGDFFVQGAFQQVKHRNWYYNPDRDIYHFEITVQFGYLIR